MARIEILVEEKSMKELLCVLLPTIVSPNWLINQNYFIRSFEGKADLQKNIPSRVKVLSNWTNEATGLILLQDQDSSDCKVLKQKLINLCDSNRDCRILVRIVCRELESWYIGDFEAIGAAYPQFDPSKYKDKARFKNPETCHASAVLKKILPGFQKVASAKKIAPFLNPETNRSQSFKQTILGIKNFFDAVEPHL